jgi:hypothetical protein
VEETVPGITYNTSKIGRDISSEAKLIYQNTLKPAVDASINKVMFFLEHGIWLKLH